MPSLSAMNIVTPFNATGIPRVPFIRPGDQYNDIPEFFGVNTEYACSDGQNRNRCYLDSAASTLMMKAPYLSLHDDLEHFSNIHTDVHNSAVLMAGRFEAAVSYILEYFNADPSIYTCVFEGSATACFNRCARLLNSNGSGEVLISLMEHHSNDLPHRHFSSSYCHIPLITNRHIPSTVDLERLELMLKSKKVRYVTITACSNVTGIINPISIIADLCAKHGVPLVVDGSQSTAHLTVDLSSHSEESAIGAYIFSGHKAYAPGTIGVMIIKKSLLQNSASTALGGGAVKEVSRNEYTLKNQVFDRENPGTPNVLAAIQLARTLQVVKAYGLQKIEEHERLLVHRMITQLQAFGDNVQIYGALPKDGCERIGVVSFNMKGINHQNLGRLLNDRFNIAVRVGCFCAHPYVRFLLRANDLAASTQLQEKGMVRVSFGLYTKQEDIDYLVHALTEVSLTQT